MPDPWPARVLVAALAIMAVVVIVLFMSSGTGGAILSVCSGGDPSYSPDGELVACSGGEVP